MEAGNLAFGGCGLMILLVAKGELASFYIVLYRHLPFLLELAFPVSDRNSLGWGHLLLLLLGVILVDTQCVVNAINTHPRRPIFAFFFQSSS